MVCVLRRLQQSTPQSGEAWVSATAVVVQDNTYTVWLRESGTLHHRLFDRVETPGIGLTQSRQCKQLQERTDPDMNSVVSNSCLTASKLCWDVYKCNAHTDCDHPTAKLVFTVGCVPSSWHLHVVVKSANKSLPVFRPETQAATKKYLY